MIYNLMTIIFTNGELPNSFYGELYIGNYIDISVYEYKTSCTLYYNISIEVLTIFMKIISKRLITLGSETIFTILHFLSILSKWVKYATLLHSTRLERLAGDKHSSLMGPFISNKENEVLLI